MYAGYDPDVVRRTRIDEFPVRDTPGYDGGWRFGGPHRGGVNVAFCDGSVTSISYEIDPQVNRRQGVRNDGEIVTEED